MHDAFDRFEPVRVDLRELSAEELRYLFATEAAARTGTGTVARNRDIEPADRLRYAAARIEHVIGQDRHVPGDLRWPHNTAALVQALQQVAETSSELVGEATETTGYELAAGRTVPGEATTSDSSVQADVVKQFENIRRTAAQQLTEAARNLEQLGALVDGLERSLGPVTTADGSTLVDEAILECISPFMSGIGRYHVRLFKASEDAKPLVAIGDLSDNQSASVMNNVEEIAATAAETLLEEADGHAVEWVQLIPAEMFPTPSTTDVVLAYERERREKIELVIFGEPFASPDFRPIDRTILEELAGGPVRFWHASNYTSAELVWSGVRVIRPETRSRVPPPETPAPIKVAVVAGPAEPARTLASEDEPRREPEAGRKRWWWPFKSRNYRPTP